MLAQLSDHQFSTPILFIIFNRPTTTRIVFEHIRDRKPRQLFIAADGPRLTHHNDADYCQQARAVVDNIDWPCVVHTLFHDKNLGCGRAVNTAISWFFSHVERGIILEDDCVPDPTFFDFCDTMLDRYNDDLRIMMIAGTSYLFNRVRSTNSYFFSRYYPVWGWATWRRAWQYYDFEIKEWAHDRQSYMLEQFFHNAKIVHFWSEYFDRIVRHELDTWDIQWTYACIKQKAFCIVPFNNLISNIGYIGTHAIGIKSFDQDIERRPIEVPHLVHPKTVIACDGYDILMYKNMNVIPRGVMLHHLGRWYRALRARLTNEM
jgi:hypothetical protein